MKMDGKQRPVEVTIDYTESGVRFTSETFEFEIPLQVIREIAAHLPPEEAEEDEDGCDGS